MHQLAMLLGKAALVVKSVKIDKTAEDCQVEIIARKAGLVSWLLSLIGIDSTFTFRAYKDRLESEEGSLSGQISTVIPLTALDTFTNGFTKPFQFVIGAIIALIMGFIMLGQNGFIGFILIIVAVVLGVLYYLRKSLMLIFSTQGANSIIFVFKRSIIEGVNVDESLAKEVADLVKENYIAQSAK